MLGKGIQSPVRPHSLAPPFPCRFPDPRGGAGKRKREGPIQEERPREPSYVPKPFLFRDGCDAADRAHGVQGQRPQRSRMRWRTNPAETRDGEKLNRPDRWIVPRLKRPGTNATHQRAGARCVDFKTCPTAGSVACDCYVICSTHSAVRAASNGWR